VKPDKQEKPKRQDKPEKVFGKGYADSYDLFYADKNYEAECDMIEEVFKKYGDGPIKSILDLGCGTGNHAISLAKRGYEVTGIDISPDMLKIARKKVFNLQPSTFNFQPIFLEGDIRSLDLGKKFDAVLMMFAVLGYQTTNKDVFAALHTVRRHLNPGGLFICDVWYGPAVLTIRPSERVKVIPTTEGKIIRVTSGSLDTFRHTCEVKYHVWEINGKQVVNESEEKHVMRYFFPQELNFFMNQASFQILNITPFGVLDKIPNEDNWTILSVARANVAQ